MDSCKSHASTDASTCHDLTMIDMPDAHNSPESVLTSQAGRFLAPLTNMLSVPATVLARKSLQKDCSLSGELWSHVMLCHTRQKMYLNLKVFLQT